MDLEVHKILTQYQSEERKVSNDTKQGRITFRNQRVGFYFIDYFDYFDYDFQKT
jgi:hypothetical protein